MSKVRMIMVGVFGILMAFVGGMGTMLYYDVENRPMDETEDLVEKYELDTLIARAKLSRQPYLESILLTIQGAMAEGTLAELINYTAAYSEHALKEHPHRKIEKSTKKSEI